MRISDWSSDVCSSDLPSGCEHATFDVELLAPEDELAARWHVATTLPAVRTDARGYGLYRADSYETLIDHPVEMADYQRVNFNVDGIPHSLVLSGRAEADQNGRASLRARRGADG